MWVWRFNMKFFNIKILIITLLLMRPCFADTIPTSSRAEKSIASVLLQLENELKSKKLEYGSPIYIRVFKASNELEMWVKKNQKYELLKTYPICSYSGQLGPKTKEGDYQAPEGFYFVKPSSLNPWSSYHLSFNLGYPNAYERSKGYTGSALMIHGKCVSIGCYAMTDEYMNEIYAMAYGALSHGQPYFRVHAFPFRMDNKSMNNFKEHKWYSFWLNLKEGYDLFEEHRIPPNVSVKNGKYYFNQGI